jgi:hypothetical protein
MIRRLLYLYLIVWILPISKIENNNALYKYYLIYKQKS